MLDVLNVFIKHEDFDWSCNLDLYRGWLDVVNSG